MANAIVTAARGTAACVTAACVTAWLAGCTLPGQVYRHDALAEPRSARDYRAQPYRLERISPTLLAQLAARDQRVPRAYPEIEKELRAYRYRIGPQDVLTFTVWDHPEITIPAGEFRDAELQGHLVSAEGSIYFPYVGEVEVVDRTLDQIRRAVSERLSVFIQDPQLDVRVVAFRSKKVHVTGQVAKPGVQPITDSPLTLVEALASAGGATSQAALQRVQLVRDGVAHTFDVQALLEHGDMRQNALLRHGDVIYVPENSFFTVHVLGEVESPRGVGMRSGRLNLAEAITQSGGFNLQNANPERVFVFRGADDTPQVFWLDAGSPDAMLLATQFEMQPQDVVFVASRQLARFNRAVGLILPTVQTLWQTQTLIDQLRD